MLFGNRDVLALVVGYTATIWGTVGLRQWIVVFLEFCAANQGGGATQGWSMLTVGALVGLLGVPAGLCGNELSLRFGLRATAIGVFLVSALVNALFGFVAILPYGVVIALAMAAGFIVQGNFSNLTSGVLAVAEPQLRGATVAVYSCIGFAGGFVGTLLFGLALDWFGGTDRLVVWVASIWHLRCCMPRRQRRKHISVARSGAGALGSVSVMLRAALPGPKRLHHADDMMAQITAEQAGAASGGVGVRADEGTAGVAPKTSHMPPSQGSDAS